MEKKQDWKETICKESKNKKLEERKLITEKLETWCRPKIDV